MLDDQRSKRVNALFSTVMEHPVNEVQFEGSGSKKESPSINED